MLRAVTALVNSGTTYGEQVQDAEQMAALLSGHRLVDGQVEVTEADFASLIDLRHRLRAAWKGDVSAAVAVVNALLKEGHALPVLVLDGAVARMTTRPRPPLAARIGAQAAAAIADCMVTGEFDRLSRCQRPHCLGLVTDLSSNRSRRFCADACATRVHVQEHRARKRGGVVEERVGL